MKKKVLVSICMLVALGIALPMLSLKDKLSAATANYTTGNKVYIGNDSYTVIDPNAMTLLKDTATSAGEVTWDGAMASLNSLPGQYGELGSKFVSNKFSLPTTTDLASITNTGNTALVTVDPISTDWWLGDASVDNRSKFVGANTNSLVKDENVVKNVLDKENHVCNMNQTVTEQGLKPTITGNDPDAEPDTTQEDYFTLRVETESGRFKTKFYTDENCGKISGETFVTGTYTYVGSSKWDWMTEMDGRIGRPAEMDLIQKALVDLKMLDYLKSYVADTSKGYEKQFEVPVKLKVCQKSGDYKPLDASSQKIKSYMISDSKSSSATDASFIVHATSMIKKAVPLECKGHAQTAGTSSVRPLLTLDRKKIAYSSATKPSFQSSSSLNQSVPNGDSNFSYLSINDSDLGIGLASGSGNILEVDRSDTISIPVTLSGATSGTRYVSAIGTTNSGEQYGILGQVDGTSGKVNLNITNFPDYQTAKTLSLTLYQEVDEGTNTTYRGNGTPITLEFNADPITAITFTPNYPSGQTSWTEGDAGINASGAKTGTFTFTGGTSGKADSTSGKDYQKWEIVDASGNVTSDANFSITGNELKAKKRIPAGTYTLRIKITDNADETFMDTITITISKLPTQNPPIKITSKDSMMYGDSYTASYSGGQGSGAVTWAIENDNGTGATVNNGVVKVTGIGSFTLKVTKAGTSSYQESTDTKVITVNKRKTIVKPKDVTKTVGSAFKDNGVTYQPQPVNGDDLGTLVITSKYPDNQAAGRYTDGIQASGLSNPNYEFEYQDGTLIINTNTLPNNGEGYYKVTGTKGKNNWYISDVEISTTNKNGYDEISDDGINFQTSPLVYSTDGAYNAEFYLKNSSTGVVAKAIQYPLKIDQTPPEVPTLSVQEINKSNLAKFINALSFGNWMKSAMQVTMTSSDATSGIDHYEYSETSQKGTTTKTSTNGIVIYKNDTELTIKAKACDKAGNCSEFSNDESIMIDTKAPTITGVKDKSEYKFYYLPRIVNVKDEYSGLSYSEYKKDGVMAGTIQKNVDEQISGVGDYEIYAIDNAGNEIKITFKIVPLPDIETEIDGSDESKKIIDQVKKEYEEIKNKIDSTEKKDIEKWIQDALDKWNSLRKKVVETDDKSAKVEGLDDTSFDPSIVLIVDDISENEIPPLPRKPLAVYDVYLQKGNVRIQADGKIKVYLPYASSMGDAMGGAGSDAKLIVYQIDENDKVTEINVQIEGDYITFVTDKLLRYAISDENQKLNDTCALNGTKVNVDTDNDGMPDVNIDLNNDCVADLNVDINGDNIPDVNIDSDGDGKAEINIDVDDDGKADINIVKITTWKPEKVVTINGFTYDTMGGLKPYLNIDVDGDGKADYNIDTNGDGIPDKNLLDDDSELRNNIGGASTGDTTKWVWWWIMLIITSVTMIYAQVKKKQSKRQS